MGAVLLGCQVQAVRILIHQASAGVQGIAADIESARREILRLNARLKELMAAGTGQSLDQISHDINRDYWMNAHEAKDCGVVDMIVGQTAATAPADRAEAALITSPRGSASRARPAPLAPVGDHLPRVVPTRSRADRVFLSTSSC